MAVSTLKHRPMEINKEVAISACVGQESVERDDDLGVGFKAMNEVIPGQGEKDVSDGRGKGACTRARHFQGVESASVGQGHRGLDELE